MMASNYLEAKLGKPCPMPNYPKGSDGPWYAAFQVREETIQDIIKQIQGMYESNKGGSGLLSANSTAVAKMKMNLDGRPREGGAARNGGAASATNGAAGSSGAGGSGPPKRKVEGGGGAAAAAAAAADAGVTRTSCSGSAGRGSEPESKEDGELDEGVVEADQTSKRPRVDGGAA